MEELDFNSQPCTSIEQGKHLIELGLRLDTADMYWADINGTIFPVVLSKEDRPLDEKDIPAWSLNRLVEIVFNKGLGIVTVKNTYDAIINIFEKRVKAGVFPKKYLTKN